jgi:3-dehydro-L-gulonate 2-dehydrogenase
MIRIPFADLKGEMERVLRARGFSADRAELSARLFAETSRDGVASHGINRFPRFIRQIAAGYVKVDAEPVRVAHRGGWEQWDGQLGPGNLNAWASTNRAMTLAREHGVALVSLRHTNHWMRAGTYGWRAAAQGCALVAWTNTTPNMPPWGTVTPKLGNPPLVIALPRGNGPIVLDMAVSQFSYGRMEVAELRGEQLPVPGGHDGSGRLTTDPGAILASKRPLPIGFWKGSALSLLLDMAAASLSGGLASFQIGQQPDEFGLSQLFFAVDVGSDRQAAIAGLLDGIVDDLHTAEPDADGKRARYPGEQVLRVRAENLAAGVPVDEQVWETVCAL